MMKIRFGRGRWVLVGGGALATGRKKGIFARKKPVRLFSGAIF